MIGLAWIGQSFRLESNSYELASLLVCNSISIGLDLGIFWIVDTCIQAWV